MVRELALSTTVGAATFASSMASLRRRGYLVLFGASSGPVGPLDVERLNSAGSLYLTRPTLGHYTQDRGEFLERATSVLKLVGSGQPTVHIGGRFPLRDAAQAHSELESRKTARSTGVRNPGESTMNSRFDRGECAWWLI